MLEWLLAAIVGALVGGALIGRKPRFPGHQQKRKGAIEGGKNKANPRANLTSGGRAHSSDCATEAATALNIVAIETVDGSVRQLTKAQVDEIFSGAHTAVKGLKAAARSAERDARKIEDGDADSAIPGIERHHQQLARAKIISDQCDAAFERIHFLSDAQFELHSKLLERLQDVVYDLETAISDIEDAATEAAERSDARAAEL